MVGFRISAGRRVGRCLRKTNLSGPLATADAALLAEAGAQVKAVGGCCGLAGNFGVERGHYDVSVAVAQTALLPAVRAAGPDAAVLADGFSCRTQLDQLAGVPGSHLAEILAAALEQ